MHINICYITFYAFQLDFTTLNTPTSNTELTKQLSYSLHFSNEIT